MLIDSLLKEEFRYEIYLCKPSDYSIIACLTECTIDRTIKRQLKSIDEFEFTIPKYWDNTRSDANAYFDSVMAGSIILVESLIDDVVQERMYFKVVEPELIGDEREYKVVRCYSLQYQWGKIRIKNFTSSNDDGSTTTTQLYVAATPWDDDAPMSSGIINYILEVKLLGTWTVNSMSTSLLGLYRTFDFADNSLLEVIEDIQNNFNCVVLFDTYNRQIDIVDYADLPSETGLILHDEGFIKKLQQKIKIDEIVTRLWVDGDNDTETNAQRTIISKNITQQPYIDDFTYFRNSSYMSTSLLNALTALDVKLSAGAATFTGYLSDLSTLQGELTTLQNELAALQVDLEIYEAKEDNAIKYGGNYDGHTYTYWHGLLTTQQGLITTKNGAITTKNNAITAKQNQITALAYTVAYDNPANFTTPQLQELLNFINEETVKCSSSDPAELLSFGTSLLTRKANPPIEFDLDIVDLFDSKELSYTWDKLVLGAKVDLVSDAFSISESPRIVSYTHSPDKCSLSVTVSNKEYLNSDLDYITALFAKSKQGADTIKKEREVYKDYVVNDKEVVKDFIDSPIDASANNIIMSTNGVDASMITRRGMYMKDADSDLGQMRILGNRIVFSKNNWNPDSGTNYSGYSLAITSDGIQTDGSFKLYSESTYGSYNVVSVDGNGIQIRGGDGSHGLQVYNKADAKVFDLDSNGNILMTGTLQAGSIISDTSISGGSITIGTGNDVFKVDTLGNMWLGHANLGSALFKVTKAGAVTASNITITGGSISVATNATIGNTLYIGDNVGTSKAIWFRTTSSEESSISMSGSDMYYDCWAKTFISSGDNIIVQSLADISLSASTDIDITPGGSLNLGGTSISIDSAIGFIGGSSIDFTNCTVSNLVVKFS